MKLTRFHTLLVFGIALLLATSAFASNRGSVMVSQDVQVAGTRLTPGEYKVMWEGNGPQVELKLMQGSKLVATVPAHMVDLKSAAVGNQAIVNKGADGTNSLSEIRLSGKKYAFQIGSESAKMSGASQ